MDPNAGRTEFELMFPQTGRRIFCRYSQAWLDDDHPVLLVTVSWPLLLQPGEVKPSIGYIQMWAKHFAPEFLKNLPIVVSANFQE